MPQNHQKQLPQYLVVSTNKGLHREPSKVDPNARQNALPSDLRPLLNAWGTVSYYGTAVLSAIAKFDFFSQCGMAVL